ncbi:MAG: hypothetical protein ACJAU4_000152 [Glaciecola sp.]|jgi:hypothetical protein
MDSLEPDITVTTSFDYSMQSVEKLYTCVFKNNPAGNIFLSYEWISTWLQCASNKPLLTTFISSCVNEPVGFAFIGCVDSVLGKVFFLNQTGNQQDDQVWIEYNDVICASQHKACRNALLHYLAEQRNTFKFVGVNNMQAWSHRHWREWSLQPINGFIAASTKPPADSCASASNTSLIAHFSKNTKSQISRSQKYIEQQYGETTVTWLRSNQVEAALKDMANLHIEQWGKHDYGSGFTNPRFVEFHRRIMQQGMQQGMQPELQQPLLPQNNQSTNSDWVHLAKFCAGDVTLGYLYFFTRNKQVYFYLSAINYATQDNKYKPGLLMHKLAMQHFEGLGYTSYDFLAGDARYKTSLSNQKYLLHSLQLYVNKWYYWPIKLCVKIKRWFIQSAKKR